MSESDLQPVSAEDASGRVLTGVGTTVDALQETMERHAPPVPEPVAPVLPLVTTAPEAPEPKKLKGRERYSELTAQRDSEKTKREQAERERDALKQRLEGLARPSAVVAAAAEPVMPAVAAASSKFTFPAYETWLAMNPDQPWDAWQDAKTDALTDWKLSQTDFEARIRQGIEADRAFRAFGDVIQQTRTRALQTYPDFDAMLQTGPGSTVLLAPTPQQAQARLQAIVSAPQSEHLQYAIAKDAALAHRLAGMSDVEFGMQLAQLAPASSVASPASTLTAGAATVPVPYQPVGSGRATTVLPSADLPKLGYDFDQSGYREKRAAERGVKHRR